jgi:hypothetical protein
MSNYTKTTDFAAKDTLTSGDAGKIIRGSEFETEFDDIAEAIATKADTASPTFTGTVTIPTATVTTFSLGGTTVTSTAAELNILDGVTSTATELNILDGVTATTAELNILDGVTVGASDINLLANAGTNAGVILTKAGTQNVSNKTILSSTGDFTTLECDSFTAGTSNAFTVTSVGKVNTSNYIAATQFRIGSNEIVDSSRNASFADLTTTGTSVLPNIRITIGSEINPTDSGTAGDLHFSSTYIYVCVATNTWKRVAISTWNPEF